MYLKNNYNTIYNNLIEGKDTIYQKLRYLGKEKLQLS